MKNRSVDHGTAGYDYLYDRGGLNLGTPITSLCTPVVYNHIMYLPMLKR